MWQVICRTPGGRVALCSNSFSRLFLSQINHLLLFNLFPSAPDLLFWSSWQPVSQHFPISWDFSWRVFLTLLFHDLVSPHSFSSFCFVSALPGVVGWLLFHSIICSVWLYSTLLSYEFSLGSGLAICMHTLTADASFWKLQSTNPFWRCSGLLLSKMPKNAAVYYFCPLSFQKVRLNERKTGKEILISIFWISWALHQCLTSYPPGAILKHLASRFHTL